MIKEELIQRSPVRILMNAIQGGLKPGEVGIIASESGIGKTSVLVQIALDKLLQDLKVIHVSFTQHNDYVLAWYESIFDEFVRRKNLENAREVKSELVKNRVLMNFNQDGMTSGQILRSLQAMIVEGGFKANALIIDGFDFSRMDTQRLGGMKQLARELNFVVWYSCTTAGSGPLYDKQQIPHVVHEYIDLIDVVITLEPKPDHIELAMSKNRNMLAQEHFVLKLDPKTLLMMEG